MPKSTPSTLAQLPQILARIGMLSELPDPESLKQLIDVLRGKNPEENNANIQILITHLQDKPKLATDLATFVLRLSAKYKQTTLYTDTGIVSDEGFLQSIQRLIGHRFLPLLPENDSVVELAAMLFDQGQDEEWILSIDKTHWDTLMSLLKVDEAETDLVNDAKNNVLNALVILSYRVAGIGLRKELMEVYPQMLDYSASFVAQNQEAVLFVNEYRQAYAFDSQETAKKSISADPLLVMIEQCEGILSDIRKRVYKTGISIRLTNTLVRLEQSLTRMHVLIDLVAPKKEQAQDNALLALMFAVVKDAKSRYRFSYIIENNTKLLSRKVTENASRVGEHYISTDAKGYKKMYKKAAIGGLLIAFMATLKILGANFSLAPIGVAIQNSAIYGLGFVLIHIIGGTVATKQPAMTAAAIASTLSEGTAKKTQQLAKLLDLIVDIFRTQFIAIVGNVSIAIPIALAIAGAWFWFVGAPIVTPEKAAYLIHDLNPFTSLALIHAAIAGVYLFLAGLIAGYYDNLAAINKIGERIRRHPLLLKVLPNAWVKRAGDFVEGNLGAIMGNFIFGCCLGSTATIGAFLGLPLDIRHIAFASANFVHGFLHLAPADQTIVVGLVSFLGVLLIGMVNLMVSFLLALMVAMRSKEVEFFGWRKLGAGLIAHLKSHPMDFFKPRSAPMTYQDITSDGQFSPSAQNDALKQQDGYAMRRLKSHKSESVGVAKAMEKPEKPPRLPD